MKTDKLLVSEINVCVFHGTWMNSAVNALKAPEGVYYIIITVLLRCSASMPSCISVFGMFWEPESIAANRRTLSTPSTKTSTPSTAEVRVFLTFVIAAQKWNSPPVHVDMNRLISVFDSWTETAFICFSRNCVFVCSTHKS